MAQAPDGEGQIRWSDGGTFAIVPSWLLDSEVSDKAIRLFAVLATYANKEELRAMPARRLLKERMGCAMSTLDVTIRELADQGAVTVVPYYRVDGGRGASSYYLNPSPVLVSVAAPSDQPEGGVSGQPEGKELEPVTNQSEELAIARSSDDRPTPRVTLDGRTNHPLNKLVEVCGIDPGNKQRMTYAATALNGRGKNQGIRDLFWLEVLRWCDEHNRADLVEKLYQEGEAFNEMLITAIERKAAKYRQTLDGAVLTPSALAKWWLDVELQRGRSKGLTGDDIRSMA